MPTGELSNTTFVIASVIKILVFLGALLTIVAYTVLLERKVVGRIQNRWGPTRVGPFGLLQPLADGLKFIFKEDLTPPYVHKFLYILAPMLALTTALISVSLIPIGGWVTIGGVHTPIQITDTNISLLIILGVTSIGVYGIALAGWSSNSQIFDARFPARQFADGELRSRTRTLDHRRADPHRQLQPARYR